MSRIPIRLRVTLAFTAVMALILVAVGAFVYLRLSSQLDDSINDGLRSRADDLTALVHGSGSGLGRPGGSSLIGGEDSFAQVLTPSGRVEDSTPQLHDQPVLTAAEAGQAATRPTFVERSRLPGIDGAARLLAAPVTAGGERLVVVVGASLDNRSESLSSLRRLFLIGGPIALLLASLAAYGATAGALRPVEAMRRRAEAISASEPGHRLPVPPAEDELSRLGETLNQLLGRLEAALERERRFVDDASHELRTPLALHKTEIEVALRYASDERELRAAIASAIEEVDRLVQLAEGMLVVARSEEGELPVEPEPIPVAELLRVVEERFDARAKESGRPLVAAGADGLVVDGDRLRLEQALTSLVDNALRHGSGEVRMWAQRHDARIEIHVSDEGPGFPAGFAAHAFERFSRADPARGRGGAGLGLAIVEAIARAHQGRAQVANRPEGGADVWIDLPQANDAGRGRAR